MNSKAINIEVITQDDGGVLADRVNEWLNDHNLEIVDIKYQITMNEHRAHYSAMIIYKK